MKSLKKWFGCKEKKLRAGRDTFILPLSYFSGIGKASASGVLIKGSDYLDGLNTEAIAGAIAALNSTTPVKTALRGGWQGKAEANFEVNLDNAVAAVVESLEDVKKEIEGVVANLVEDFAMQDQKMIEID